MKYKERLQRIYLMGVGGVGMGTLAAMLKSRGYEVAGSDRGEIYSPMKEFLEKHQIKVYKRYDPKNIIDFSPDLIIVGNVISTGNPELQMLYTLKGVHYISMPEAIKEFFLKDKKVIVIAGTHGKTTTTTLTAWLLYKSGLDPSFFAGGISRDFGSSFRLGEKDWFVIEGDEYDSAFFDKSPKFLHYIPDILGITAIEYDHADIFPSLEHIKEFFVVYMLSLKRNGIVIYNGENNDVVDVVKRGKPPASESFSLSGGDWKGEILEVKEDYQRVRIFKNGEAFLEADAKIFGDHNLRNILLATAIAHHAGASVEGIVEGIESFQGAKRRQEVVYKDKDYILIDDFAHHPTAIIETIRSVKMRFPLRRVWAIFEPRSNTSRRQVFQLQFPNAFAEADVTIISRILERGSVPEEELLDVEKVVDDIGNHWKKEAYVGANPDHIVKILKEKSRPGDLFLIMSNGSFGGLKGKIIRWLGEKN